MPLTATSDNIADILADNKLVLIDFWAEWCGPCRSYAPVFTQAAAEHPDVAFAKVDIEAEQELARQHGVQSIPTTVAFRNGEVVASQMGALSSTQLDAFINRVSDDS